MKNVFFVVVIAGLILLPIGYLSAAQEDSKKKVEEIFEQMESLEEHVDEGEWDQAAAEIKKLEQSTKVLVASLNLKDEDIFSKRISHLTEGMRNAVQEKENEGMEIPYYNLQKLVLEVMGEIDYQIPPVFIFLADHLDEAEEAAEKGDFEKTNEEMEEFVNLRDELREAAEKNGIPDQQVLGFLMLTFDIENACERGDKEIVLKDIRRMKQMMKSFVGQG